MRTRHRTDISFADLTVLAQFILALDRVFINSDSPVYDLGETEMLLPLWIEGENGWELTAYKVFRQQALGISRNGMIHTCKDYLQIPMRDVLDVLYRLSMLAVVPGTRVGEKPPFRLSFDGSSRSDANIFGPGYRTKFVKEGFIIEKRRIVYGFRKGEGDE